MTRLIHHIPYVRIFVEEYRSCSKNMAESTRMKKKNPGAPVQKYNDKVEFEKNGCLSCVAGRRLAN